MTIYICPRCHAELHSRNALEWHALQVEGCYPSTFDSVADTLRSRIDTLRGKVEFLLFTQPSTRGSDNFLAGWYSVIFAKTHYYDAASQSFVSKRSVPLSELRYQVKEGSLSRLRRFCQRYDRETYHDADGATIIPHLCILPSAQLQLRRGLEAEESRRLWVTAAKGGVS